MMKGWRTLGFNTIAGLPAVLMVVGQMAGLDEIKHLVPVEYLPIYTAVVTGLNLYLRTITNTPVGKKN